MRSDLPASALGAVGEVRRDIELPLVTLFHQLECLTPASNHAVERKGDRFATLVGTIENSPVGKRSVIMHRDQILCRRLMTVTRLDHSILQTTLGGRNTLFRLIIFK